MQKLMKGIALILLLAFSGCQKTTGIKGVLVRDCTGTYLKIDNKDWQICNKEKVAMIEDGTEVTASFRKISGCDQRDVICMMFHASEGWITILDIR
jgi:hypothetical protein